MKPEMYFSPGANMFWRDGDSEPVLTRSFSFDPASLNEDTREIDVIASTGALVRRYDWDRRVWFDEELRMTPDAHDFTRIENGVCPALFNHDRWSGQIGIVRSGEMKGGQMRQRIQVARDVNDFIEEKWKLIQQGMLNAVSIGYRVTEYALHRAAKEGEVDRYEAVKWSTLEASLVLIPADAGAHRV
jgi:phage head maturation protease